MLTVRQMETVAFDRGCGEVICPPCARERYSEIELARAEEGLDERDDLQPLARFTLVESAIEHGWGEAEERVVRFAMEHPELAEWLTKDDLLNVVTRDVALQFGRESCYECGAALVELGPAYRIKLRRLERELGRELRWGET